MVVSPLPGSFGLDAAADPTAPRGVEIAFATQRPRTGRAVLGSWACGTGAIERMVESHRCASSSPAAPSGERSNDEQHQGNDQHPAQRFDEETDTTE